MSDVSMREMLEAGVHFGHQTRLWHPKMAPYLFGQRHKIHIIDLEHSLPMYREAMNFLGAQASKKSRILFVGTKRPAQRIIREQAMRCGMPYVNRRWLGGLLTNFKTVSSSVKRLKNLEAMRDDGGLVQLSKKEALTLMRELGKLNASLSGIKDMDKLPNVLFVIDIGYENIAVTEAKKLGIPVVGIVDSNNDPARVDHVIPGNDDAIRAIQLYCSGAADTILAAREAAAHLSEAEAEEFVELDEEGNPIQPEEKSPRTAAGRKTKTSTGKKRSPDEPLLKGQMAPNGAEETGDAGAESAGTETKPGETDNASATSASTETKPGETDNASATSASTETRPGEMDNASATSASTETRPGETDNASATSTGTETKPGETDNTSATSATVETRPEETSSDAS